MAPFCPVKAGKKLEQCEGKEPDLLRDIPEHFITGATAECAPTYPAPP